MVPQLLPFEKTIPHARHTGITFVSAGFSRSSQSLDSGQHVSGRSRSSPAARRRPACGRAQDGEGDHQGSPRREPQCGFLSLPLPFLLGLHSSAQRLHAHQAHLHASDHRLRLRAARGQRGAASSGRCPVCTGKGKLPSERAKERRGEVMFMQS